jgi:hypothetical protein
MPLPIISPSKGQATVKNALGMIGFRCFLENEAVQYSASQPLLLCFYTVQDYAFRDILIVQAGAFTMSVRDVFFNVVCPTLGVVIALTMFLTPMRSVVQARRDKSLGELNPVPWAVTFVNCMGWVIYACFKL